MNQLRIASAVGFLGVLLGAFGAHALKQRISAELLASYQTGVQYHLLHAVALLGLALARDDRRFILAQRLWLLGVIVFSGSLYVYAAFEVRQAALITPLGGLFFMAGWLALGSSKRETP